MYNNYWLAKFPLIKSEIFYDKQKIIITYLPQNLSSSKFYELVSAIGPLEYCKLIEKTIGNTTFNMGYGFARYKSEEDAAIAMQKLNGLRICNKIIKVCNARQQSHLIKESNVYISGIPRSMTEEAFFDLCNNYGTIVNYRLLYDKVDKTRLLSRGVGFVRFNTSIEAQAAISGLNGIHLNGSVAPLCAKLANSYNQQINNTYVLYICNFPEHWKSITIDKLFSEYATVLQVQVICRGNSRYGFVTVGGYAQALSAIHNLNGRIFSGHCLTVSFKYRNITVRKQ